MAVTGTFTLALAVLQSSFGVPWLLSSKEKKHGLDRGSVVNQELKSSGMGSKMVLKNINSEKYLSMIQLNYSSITASIL